ncbi:MAG: hypothetical protein M3069_01200, partial [Chloroflexota bacterium]|nr:hypothetical protein [Chloroflexota bacterium]
RRGDGRRASIDPDGAARGVDPHGAARDADRDRRLTHSGTHPNTQADVETEPLGVRPKDLSVSAGHATRTVVTVKDGGKRGQALEARTFSAHR